MPCRILHETPLRLRLRPGGLDLARVEAGALASRIEAVPGVDGVRVNARAGCVVVEHDGRRGTRERVLRTLAGLRAADLPPPDGTEAAEASPGPLVFTGAAALASLLLPPPLRLALTLASIAPTLARGARVLARRGVKVEVLDALSIGLAAARQDYFTACATQFLLELSEYIEASTRRRSDALIRRLLRPNPDTAMVERDGEVITLAFALLVEGDRVHVQAGEMIPVDGRVLAGGATVNQSSVTGESLPIPKEADDPVLSGTVVEEGRLVILAERVGEATTTARISRFIQEALNRRGDIQRVAEDLADRRVWISLGSGALVFALTRDTRRLASMFLVDYSCALKLGAAVAVKSALYQSARRGILLKGGPALEALAGIDTVVFDKTGTLTHGRLVVTDVLVFDPESWPRERFLATIASVAEHSTHPVAAAVVGLARAEGMHHIGHEEVDFVIGHGLTTRVEAGTLHIGSRHYLVDHERVAFAQYTPLLDGYEAEGKTVLHVALDGRPLGVIALRDRRRAEAAETLAALRRLGVRRLVMVTGDRRESAHHIADGLGLDEIICEADPEQKAAVLQELKQHGHKVAYVGDGVNDGPALMTAHLGIAMPRASDIARATADMVLLEDRLEALVEAMGVARATMATIRRNFAAAVGVNTAIMGGASLGVLPPVLSSLLHNGTTIALLADAMAGDGQRAPGTLPRITKEPIA
ncbi:heavy metal translocating P-type ATPase [Rhodovastum atsumiense]|uniref:heavy metal translocating P-type ATPase n=1 Tax=Rhodovastum atsumiense TaxID=504468 RepID=UPI00193B1E93|nr:heavy metal translocating P-type ATPase [Rhodovastum atsumiense]